MAEQRQPSRDDILSKRHPAVDSQLAGVQTLSSFLQTTGQLSLGARRLLVAQARTLIEDFYAHLPLKKAMHAVDPIQSLKLLDHRFFQLTAQTMPSELQFHSEMLDIFISLRDLHTNYLLPAPFSTHTAFLPFQVESYFENGSRRYVVSRLIAGFTHDTFQPGVTVLHWNGVPIDRAAELNGERQAGSNLPARHARGLEALTIRPMATTLPPDAEWVVVRYEGLDHQVRELRFDWLVFSPDTDTRAVDPNSGEVQNSAALGIDAQQEAVMLAKKVLFAPQAVAAARDARGGQAVSSGDTDLPTLLPGVFRARSVDTPHGTFGYIRIFTFSVNDPDAFVCEFSRLAEALPGAGLILDVRGNGGGHIHASERTLQLLTPNRIEPEPVQFINTPLTLQVTQLHSPSPLDSSFDLSPWTSSIAQAVETGATFSRGVPITPRERANDVGQKYHGPVVLITDALCYSATDIFAAGFQDHNIGPILGIDDNTGAGGANVWTHGLLQLLFEGAADSPFESLPNGANMRVSIRRTLRVGERSGTPLEDLGVVPDERHFMTRNDVLSANVDLITAAARILSELPPRTLNVDVQPQAGSSLGLRVTTQGMNRLDIYLDGRPQTSRDVSDGTIEMSLENGSGADLLELQGFEGSNLVAARKVSL